MANTFDWIELNAVDMELLSKFHKNVFGWEMKDVEKVQGYEVRIFHTGGNPRMENISRFGIWEKPKTFSGGVLVNIRVDNIEHTLATIVKNGGRVAEEKNFIGPGYRAVFSDPEGNHFALFEDK